MFYGQCWTCGERWELGTASTCTCPELVNYTFKMDKDSSTTYAFEASMYSKEGIKIDPITGDVGIGTPALSLQEPKCVEAVKWDASAPLVITPHPAFQKRTWVGLTELEGRAIAEWQLAGLRPIKAVIEAIEAKLKEKNT